MVESYKFIEDLAKVKWTRVPDLIEKRKVFLQGGWAYVPGHEQSSIVFQEFELCLTKALEVTTFTTSYLKFMFTHLLVDS